ncbi:hypothetical protein L533_4243 [Bordetella bronchiseptica OSU553]|nr:hypothetical protein CSB91_0570 [Pseudomonas aeruginosa]KDD56892.1 hypothetical protein L533_4243 [Bordetella bronchiseptica OSU553]
MLTTLDLTHVRTRNACPRCELVLRDSLSDARSAHGLSEG